jgi:hypothetical protein
MYRPWFILDSWFICVSSAAWGSVQRDSGQRDRGQQPAGDTDRAALGECGHCFCLC